MNKLKFVFYIVLVAGLFLLLKFKRTNYFNLTAYVTAHTVNAVIEIPAGTNMKYEYHPSSNRFKVEKIDDIPTKIKFLPYPVNYGFIPSTLMDTLKGGNGGAMDILVISESVPMKTVLEVLPIAILKIKDQGEIDHKIIAVPLDEELQIIEAVNFFDLETKYQEAMSIIETWFTSYNTGEVIEFIGWEDERAAMKSIAKWNLD